MTKPDDSSLDLHDLKIIESRAAALLDKAEAWDRFPVPMDDLLTAANVKVAPHSVFDPLALLAYIKGKADTAVENIKSAVSKVFGIYDASDNVIHVDQTVAEPKQNFLMLHETGHHDIPTHKKVFRLFQDCEKTLAPEIADQFEREANNYARFTLFKGDTFMRHAADCSFTIKTPIKLAPHFGASLYASVREFARTNQRSCVVYALDRVKDGGTSGILATVRRIETSSKFREEFGQPFDTVISASHVLARIVPIGRKMTRPTPLSIQDRNGVSRKCIAEAFDTTHNILILVYPLF